VEDRIGGPEQRENRRGRTAEGMGIKTSPRGIHASVSAKIRTKRRRSKEDKVEMGRPRDQRGKRMISLRVRLEG
jgi:hypothetical protein